MTKISLRTVQNCNLLYWRAMLCVALLLHGGNVEMAELTNLQKQLKDYHRQGYEIDYLINYMFSMSQYTEEDVLREISALGFAEMEIVDRLSYQFAIDMDWYYEKKAKECEGKIVTLHIEDLDIGLFVDRVDNSIIRGTLMWTSATYDKYGIPDSIIPTLNYYSIDYSKVDSVDVRDITPKDLEFIEKAKFEKKMYLENRVFIPHGFKDNVYQELSFEFAEDGHCEMNILNNYDPNEDYYLLDIDVPFGSLDSVVNHCKNHSSCKGYVMPDTLITYKFPDKEPVSIRYETFNNKGYIACGIDVPENLDSVFRDTLKFMRKNYVVNDYFNHYRVLTDKSMPSIDSMTQYDICEWVKDKIEDYTFMYDIEIDFEDIAVYGSRSRNLVSEDSDLDIVVQYSGDFKEDYVHSILAEMNLEVDGIEIDINPIQTDISQYLYNAEKYLYEKKVNMIFDEKCKALALELDEISHDIDYYEYMDNLEGDRDKAMTDIWFDLKKGNIESYIKGIDNLLLDSEDRKMINRGDKLKTRLNALISDFNTLNKQKNRAEDTTRLFDKIDSAWSKLKKNIVADTEKKNKKKKRHIGR